MTGIAEQNDLDEACFVICRARFLSECMSSTTVATRLLRTVKVTSHLSHSLFWLSLKVCADFLHRVNARYCHVLSLKVCGFTCLEQLNGFGQVEVCLAEELFPNLIIRYATDKPISDQLIFQPCILTPVSLLNDSSQVVI